MAGNNAVWPITDAARDVLEERSRQVREEHYSASHDDEHDAGELAAAASCYAMHAADVLNPYSQGDGTTPRGEGKPAGWPWDAMYWKPRGEGVNQHGARHDLVRAAALILAEIERVDRERSRNGTGGA